MGVKHCRTIKLWISKILRKALNLNPQTFREESKTPPTWNNLQWASASKEMAASEASAPALHELSSPSVPFSSSFCCRSECLAATPVKTNFLGRNAWVQGKVQVLGMPTRDMLKSLKASVEHTAQHHTCMRFSRKNSSSPSLSCSLNRLLLVSSSGSASR